MSSASSSSSSITSLLDYVEKLKSENVAKFRELVISHLSINLDLDGEALEELIDDEDWVGEPLAPFSSFRKRKKPRVVPKISEQFFGSALTFQHIAIMSPLFDHLSQAENLKHEGVFRKNGNIERQRSLRERLEKHEQICYKSSSYTIHDCAGILKAFVGELPDTLLTSRHFNAYTQIAAMKEECKQMRSLQLLVQLLPPENFTLLQQLLQLLSAVAEEPSNLMDARNLAIVFAMHVIVPKRLSVDEQRCAQEMLTPVLTLMIQRSDRLFCYPTQLVLDVTQYQVKASTAPGSAASSRRISSSTTGSSRMSTTCSSSKSKGGRKLSMSSSKSKRKETLAEEAENSSDDDEIVITSSVVFADRKASTEAAETSNTETALAELCAHIASMPESAQKRQLINKMRRTYRNVPINSADGKHSITRSIRELFTCRKRRVLPLNGTKSACQALHQEETSMSCRKAAAVAIDATPSASRTARSIRPCVTRLFADDFDDAKDSEKSPVEDETDDELFAPLPPDEESDSDSDECQSKDPSRRPTLTESCQKVKFSEELHEDSDKENEPMIENSQSSYQLNYDLAASGYVTPVGKQTCVAECANMCRTSTGLTEELRKLKGYISPIAFLPPMRLDVILEQTPS